jgi:PPOX class probable F420-dependent enzyme
MADHFDPAALPPEVLAFLAERHLATLTTLRPDGSPHVAPVGFTFDPERRLVRVITFAAARKVRNVRAAGPQGAPAAVCQVDGGRWLTLEGRAFARDDAAANHQGVERYAARYRRPNDRPDRVTIELAVARVLGRV